MRGGAEVLQWQSEIVYPFIYLDSSFILRSQEINTEILTRKFSRKNPEKCKKILKELQLESQNDNDYYKKIDQLQQNGRLSTFITMETLNSYVQVSRPNQIALFGTVNNPAQINITNQQDWNLENTVLWEESVDFKTFNKAAIAIANAKCVIADAAFFQISAGRSLAEYITTGCHFLIASTDIKKIKMGSNYLQCELPPKVLIEYLSSDF